MTGIDRTTGGRPQWRSDLELVAAMMVAILIASQLAEGTTRYVIMFGIVVVLAVVVRVSRGAWPHGASRRIRRRI
jgi:hypothetical protein